MSNILILLGADRVGKSTLIKRISEYLRSSGRSKVCLHFAGPALWHNSPIDQYLIPLKDVRAQWVLCDRGGPEVCFYEKYRRNVDISTDWALKFEEYVQDNFEKSTYVLLKRDWEWCVDKHVEEIKFGASGCTPFWIESNLEMRYNEHKAYYAYMEHYFTYISTQPVKEIYTNEGDLHEILDI